MNRYPITHTDYLSRDEIAWFRKLCPRTDFLEDVARAVQTALGMVRPIPRDQLKRDWRAMHGKAESLLQDLRTRIYPAGYFSALADDLETFVATAAETIATLEQRPTRKKQKNPVHRDAVRTLAEAFEAQGVPVAMTKGGTFEEAVARVFDAAARQAASNAHIYAHIGMAPDFPADDYVHDLVRDALRSR